MQTPAKCSMLQRDRNVPLSTLQKCPQLPVIGKSGESLSRPHYFKRKKASTATSVARMKPIGKITKNHATRTRKAAAR